MSPRHHRLVCFTTIALLLLLAYLQLSTLAITSPTMDETNHLVSGYAFLVRGDTRIKLNGPILNNLIGAIPLLLQPGLKLAPADDPAWDLNKYVGIADDFVWNNTVSPFRIMYLARLPFTMIGWLLGALIFRWARERSTPTAGLFALTLYVFCPNLLAHSRFVMTDSVPATMTCLTLYSFARFRKSQRSSWQAATGIALGLALASKFSLLMLVPALAILALAVARRQLISRTIIMLGQIFALAAVTVWGVYAFQVAPVAAGGFPVPAPGYWGEWLSARYYLGQPWPNYLFGQISPTGWWYYFPIAFVVKTPLPVLILLIVALVRTALRRSWRRDTIFLLPGSLILFALLFSTNNLGYRYLLPLLPLIFVYISDLVPKASRLPLRSALAALLVWQIVGTLRSYPYYLTFFNELIGGPDKGRYILSDSNIDWGQDLVGLKQYVDKHHIDRIKLSYFGIAHPTAYGLKTEALPPVRTAMHDQGAWWLHTYYPNDPPPGIYAISVANLMGGIWIDRQVYAYFRDRTPDTTIGHSIYIYTVPSHGAPANLSLSGLQIDQIDPATYRLFETNDVRPRWFDATSSLIAAPGQTWIAIADDRVLALELAPLFEGEKPVVHAMTTDARRPYALYHFDLAGRILQAAQQSEQAAQEVKSPVQFGETAELIGYTLTKTDQTATLVTYWRAGKHIVTPLQLFVHALGPEGHIVAQEDQLDAPAFGWREGDLIAQVNHLTLPTGAKRVWIQVGLYNAETGERLPVIVQGHPGARELVLKQIDL